MKKFILGSFFSLLLWFWAIFAQNILPDSAEISVKSPIIQWEATNLTITMIKNWSKMTSYNWSIFITITDQNGNLINPNEYTLPNRWMYTFLTTDLWSKEFQKWLEIKKEWTFFIEISDLNEDKIFWRQEIKVIKNNITEWNHIIEILSPAPNATLTNEKVEIIWLIPELPNSQAIIYIDDEPVSSTTIDSQWTINYILGNISIWKHSLKIEVPDIEWNILWSSEKIYFTTSLTKATWIKNIVVNPENWLMVWDLIDITVYTDEIIESVKLKLSDRSENDSIIMNKLWNWEFNQKVFLIATWTIYLSLETSASSSSIFDTYDNIKQITVLDGPSISNVKVETDAEKQSALISRDTLNWPISSYLINYWVDDWLTISWENRTDKQSFMINNIPYNTNINLTITPYRDNQSKHWAASKTIQFIITKPWETTWWAIDFSWIDLKPPRCTVQNISTRTTKIWNSYYLIRDKVENVSKYIVYSSTLPDWSDKTKVYETSDTSYEYPFDHTSEEDKFVYFWIVWVCDDWEEIELSGATKVQVWPAENFLLLLCLTFLVYFWIKIFRQTEE